MKYRTAYDVWLEKTGQATPPPPNDACKLGIILEPALFDYAQAELGVKMKRNAWRVRENLGATPDGVAENFVLEIKTTGLLGPIVDDWHELPPRVMAQVQAQVWVWRKQGGVVLALIGGLGLRWYEVTPDQDWLRRILHAASEMEVAVKEGRPPKGTGTMPYLSRRRRKDGRGQEVPKETLLEYWRASEDLKEAKARAEKAKRRIVTEMGDAGMATYDGRVMLTYYPTRTGSRRLQAKAALHRMMEAESCQSSSDTENTTNRAENPGAPENSTPLR